MTLASSSVRVVLRKIFLTRSVLPEGMMIPVVGIGGSPSFCCKLSAITRKARKPIFIRWWGREEEAQRRSIDSNNLKLLILCVTYLWVDGEGFVRLADTQEVIDDFLHGKVQSFL